MGKITAAQKKRMARVSDLGCLACGCHPVEIHHCRHASGMGQRNHDHITALCPWHHRLGPDSRHENPRKFAELHGNDKVLHEETKALLRESTSENED